MAISNHNPKEQSNVAEERVFLYVCIIIILTTLKIPRL